MLRNLTAIFDILRSFSGFTKEREMLPPLVTIETDKYTIGRALGNSLILEELAISRQHCIIEKSNGRWVLIDRSANGVKVNTVNIGKNTQYCLKDGDVIQLSEVIAYEFHTGARRKVIGMPAPSPQLLLCTESKFENGITKPTLKLRAEGDNQPSRDDVIDLSNTSVINIPESPIVKKVLPAINALQKHQQKDPLPSTSRVSLEPMKDELTCSICTEIFLQATTLNCMHSFCSFCIAMWRKNNNLCPICRTNIADAVPSLVIDNLCKNLLPYMSEEDRTSRTDLMKSRDAETAKLKTKKPAARGRGARRGRGRGGRQVVRNLRPIEIEISSSDSDSDDMDDDDFFMFDEDDLAYGLDDDMFYTGIPGRYFGGYGSCYICHQPGHWANGCPNRR